MKTSEVKKVKKDAMKTLQLKASLFDELMGFIEEKYFGGAMAAVENEPNVSLKRAKRALL